MRRTWVVLGGTGFVGRAVVAEAVARGAHVRVVAAPRWLADPAWSTEELLARSGVPARLLRPSLAGADVVVNAAGLADPGAVGSPLLHGANALLPAVVVAAAPAAARVVHVSSAAVQGSRPVLDSSEDMCPDSPYGRSKALGELSARGAAGRSGRDLVVARCTSVQGTGRPTSRSLVRFARSPLACVAGDGTAPVPVVLLDSTARWLVDLGEDDGPRTAGGVTVVQPWEGRTNGGLLRELGGRDPWHLPEAPARLVLRVGMSLTRRLPAGRAAVRRVELLWVGQRVAPGPALTARSHRPRVR